MAKKSGPDVGACGHPVNGNGNCSSSGCWNSNDKRHEGGAQPN